MRAVALSMMLAMALAPFQCASTPDPDRRPEDTPSEALIALAERFGEEGDPDARRATLRYLIERYPDSREAERARVWLAREGSSGGTAAEGAVPESGGPERATPESTEGTR